MKKFKGKEDELLNRLTKRYAKKEKAKKEVHEEKKVRRRVHGRSTTSVFTPELC